MYDFLCGRIEVNGHSALETVQQLQSNDRLAEAFQRLLMGPFELLAMFPSSQIFFRGVSAYQYKQICQSF